MHRRNSLWLLSAAVVVSGLVGCAARSEQLSPEAPEAPEAPAAPGQPSPTSAPEQEQGDIGSLEAALARDENTLRSLVTAVGTASPKETTPPAPPAETPTTEPPTAGDTMSGGAPQLESESHPCDRACRALDSMRRSAEGICRLSDDEPERCERAQSRVEAAEGLVRGAGCSC